MAETIEIVHDGAVARLWLARPEQHNALAAELVDEGRNVWGVLRVCAAPRRARTSDTR